MTSQPESPDHEMVRTIFDAVTEELEPGVLLVRMSGEIDIASTELAAEAIRAAVVPPTRLVLIDLSAVTFCSSAGLGNLVEARRLAGQHGIDLALVGVGRPVDRPLSITGLGGQFRIFASAADALRQREG
ncbi:stage II sporulation protein AA (anti-sigma F factor antagonist) [Kribbella voronezhensis]|uniref:Anti-sigma factor antagonist n=1 Tax=Kribbella voronezhensis TaxID=2512212 RepID=A0A4R7TAV0_9ACTN|nr:STAS domain-containing protein [Kribbella voronezhensis]TDU89162.1 stage II sporulation protein AA (anti-sigma F factor antagonist) [Kribbella voronezhensis]